MDFYYAVITALGKLHLILQPLPLSVFELVKTRGREKERRDPRCCKNLPRPSLTFIDRLDLIKQCEKDIDSDSSFPSSIVYPRNALGEFNETKKFYPLIKLQLIAEITECSYCC